MRVADRHRPNHRIAGGRHARRTSPGGRFPRLTIVLVLVGFGAAACSSVTATPSPTGPTTATIAFTAGSPWSGALVPVALPVPVNSVVATTCPTTSNCWGIGSTVGSGGAPNGAAVIATTDGGGHWVDQAIPATVGYLSAVACGGPRQCVAAGQGQSTQGIVITTVDGGRTWTPGTLPTDVTAVTAVDCRTGLQCLAIASTASGDVALTSTAAATWTQVGTLPAGVGGVRGISCVGATACWVTGYTMPDADHVSGVVLESSTGGATWVDLPLPARAGFLNGISCVSGPADRAGTVPPVATTAPVPATTQAGATAPTTGTVPPPAGAGDAGVRCAAVGTTATTTLGARTGRGLVLTTENGGATWASRSVPAMAAGLLGVSCTAPSTCVAVGNTVVTTPQAGVVLFTGRTGAPWTDPTVLTTPQALTGVSCVSTNRCVVVGESLSEHLGG